MRVAIISSSDGIALTALRCLALKGHKGHLFSIWISPGFAKKSRFCNHHAEWPTYGIRDDMRAMIANINAFSSKHEVDLLVPAGLWGTYFLAKHRSQFECPLIFPTPTHEQIARIHDKWHFYELCKQFGIPTPATTLIKSGHPIPAHVGFPVIVKPRSGGNSDGIHVINNLDELYRLLATFPLDTNLLAQEFIHGYDAVFGFAAQNGDAIASTLHKKSRNFIHFFNESSIHDAAQALIRATSFSGCGNFDVRYDSANKRFVFLECNPRLWASFGVSMSVGVDFLEEGSLIAQGKHRNRSNISHVHRETTVPHQSPFRFANWIISGRYSAARTHQNALAWATLLDPIASIVERTLRKNIARTLDDNMMLDPV